MTQEQIAFLKILETNLPPNVGMTDVRESPQHHLCINLDVIGPQHPRQIFVFADELQASVDNGTLSKTIRQDLTDALNGTKPS
ncbi:MAG: hypothetical protein ACYDDS_18990 [Candidatus Sulfotelmatobacter sp.]